MNIDGYIFSSNLIAFTFLFVGYFLTTGTRLVDSELLKLACRFVAVVFFLLNLLVGRTIKRSLIIVFCLLLLILIFNRSIVVINIIFFALILKSVERLNGKGLVVALLVPTGIVVLTHLIAYSAGLLHDVTTEVGDRNRSALGFTNANQVASVYLSLVFLALFAHHQYRTQFSLLLLIGSFLCGFVVVEYSDSRTTMFALLMLMIFQLADFLFGRFRLWRTFILYLSAASPLFASLLTYGVATSENVALNIILSFRPEFFGEFIGQASLFEMVFGWPVYEGAGVDNLFLMLLSAVGVIGYVVIAFLVFCRITQLRSDIFPMIIVMLSVSVFEAFLIRPEIPVSALFVYIIFSPNMRRRYSIGRLSDER